MTFSADSPENPEGELREEDFVARADGEIFRWVPGTQAKTTVAASAVDYAADPIGAILKTAKVIAVVGLSPNPARVLFFFSFCIELLLETNL